jgi:hypothetical protein
MRWASAISDRTSAVDALDEAIESVRRRLDRLDLAIVFASPSLARQLGSRLADVAAGTLVGCSGAGIIGAAREIEDRPAVSVTAAELPGERGRREHDREVEPVEPAAHRRDRLVERIDGGGTVGDRGGPAHATDMPPSAAGRNGQAGTMRSDPPRVRAMRTSR